MIRPKHIASAATSFLLLPLLAYAFFFRSADEDAPQVASGAVISLSLASIIFVLLCSRLAATGKAPSSREMRTVLLFFLASITVPLISHFILQPNTVRSLQFSMEMAANALLFFVFYFSVRFEYITVRTISVFMAALGLYAGLSALGEFLELKSALRRLQGDSGTNLLGSVTAVSTLACLFLAHPAARMYGPVRIMWIIAAALALMLLFLIGSRQAIMAFSVSALVFAVCAFGFARVVLLIFAVLLGANFAYVAFTAELDMERLLDRFTAASVLTQGQQRMNTYMAALSEVDAGAFLFGRPDLYEVWREDGINPHNLFISSLRHLGIFPTLLLILALVMTAAKVRRAVRMSVDGVTVLAAGLYLLLAFLYVMASGNMTRSFNLPIFWGLALGAADAARMATRPKM